MKLLIINGPNLNLLGIREPSIYGGGTYADLVSFIQNEAAEFGAKAEIFQSNHEGEIVEKIQNSLLNFDAIVINPAAYTHTSIAILDALKAVNLPAVEVHLSDISQREEFRQHSYTALACMQTITGHGFEGYRMAIACLKDYFDKKTRNL